MPFNDSRKFYIYGLAETDPFRIRYVGRTCKALQRRLAEHQGNAGRPAVREWIDMLPHPGPAIVILGRAVGLDSADQQERRWIDTLLARGADLLNQEVLRG